MLGVAGGSHHVLLLLLVVTSLEPATRTFPICHLANLPFLDCLAVNKHSRPAALSDEFSPQTGMAVSREVIPLVAVGLAVYRDRPCSGTQVELVTPAPVGWVAGRDGRGCAESLAAGSSHRDRGLHRLPGDAGCGCL